MLLPSPCLNCNAADAGQPQVLLGVLPGLSSGQWRMCISSRYFAGLPLSEQPGTELSASGAAIFPGPDGFELRYNFAKGET